MKNIIKKQTTVKFSILLLLIILLFTQIGLNNLTVFSKNQNKITPTPDPSVTDGPLVDGIDINEVLPITPTHEKASEVTVSTLNNWRTYSDSDYEISINYLEDWSYKVLVNNYEPDENVNNKRIEFRNMNGALVYLSVWENWSPKNELEWIRNITDGYFGNNVDIPPESNIMLNTISGYLIISPTDQRVPPILFAVISHEDILYVIEYLGFDGGNYQEEFVEMLGSFSFDSLPDNDQLPSPPLYEPLNDQAQAQDCCGYQDPQSNRYECPQYGGNCTWWAAYKSPDISDLWIGHAFEWLYWAPSVYGLNVGESPQVGATVVFQPGEQGAHALFGHVGHVEEVNGSNFRYTSMWWVEAENDCTIHNDWAITSSGVGFIYPSGGGGDCPAPSLISPADGYVSSGQTITFRWSAPNCTHDGYTFRIKDTPDMNSGGTTLVDTGEGGTSRTETIGSEWNSRDLYWGVRTSDPLSSWSVRRFRIEPDSPPPGGNWTANYYDNHDRWWDTNSTGWWKCGETISGAFLDKNYGSSAPCGGMDPEEWVGDYSTTYDFPSGNYVFWLEHDDGARLWLNGSEIQIRSSSGSGWVCPARYLSGNTQLRVMLREDGGDAKIKLSWTTDTSGCISCPAVTDEVILYDSKDCGGDGVVADHPGLFTLVNTFNDRAESIAVPSNWSARLYLHDSELSPDKCYPSTDSDFWNDTFSDGTDVANQATWLRIYDNTSCIGPPPTPENLRIIATTESSVTFTWDDVPDEIGYKIYRWDYDGADWAFLHYDNVGQNVISYEDWGLDCGTDYYYEVSATNSNGESSPTGWIQGTTGNCPVIDPDPYEPDDDPSSASVMSSGSPQTHTIYPAGDEDWMVFTIIAEAEITLETTGTPNDDTRMWLMDSSLSTIEYNDDGGTDWFSFIDRVCGVDSLSAGTYYVKVDEYNDDDEIPSYDITYNNVQYCSGGQTGDNVGFYVPDQLKWYLKNNQTDGWTDITAFNFGGPSGSLAVSGDWDNDGVDTVGFYVPSQGKWYLKNNQINGWNDYVTVSFAGPTGSQAVAGDWNNDGLDTIGFYVPDQGKWYLKNNLLNGWFAFVSIRFAGPPGSLAVAGDWDGDSVDTIGFYVPSQLKWYLKNNQINGWNDYMAFKFGGPSGSQPVAGDWD